MDREELRAKLVREGFNDSFYSVDGDDGIGERHVLAQRPNGWHVYYAERGRESSRREFDTEDEACRYLLEQLEKSPGTRFHPVVGPFAPDEADRAFDAWKLERPWRSLTPDDVRVDKPPLRSGEPGRRYWVRGSKFIGR